MPNADEDPSLGVMHAVTAPSEQPEPGLPEKPSQRNGLPDLCDRILAHALFCPKTEIIPLLRDFFPPDPVSSLLSLPEAYTRVQMAGYA